MVMFEGGREDAVCKTKKTSKQAGHTLERSGRRVNQVCASAHAYANKHKNARARATHSAKIGSRKGGR